MQEILQIDHRLFTLINQKWISHGLDRLMPFVTNIHNTWWIVLLACFFWILAQRMTAVKIILGCLLAVGLSDSISYRVVKDLIHRERPEFALGAKNVRLLTYSHTGYSFPSSHAANSFSVATYITLALPGAALIVYPIACLISYSRVYIGVHFPLDVLGGAALGMLCALLIRRIILALSVLIGLQKTKTPG